MKKITLTSLGLVILLGALVFVIISGNEKVAPENSQVAVDVNSVIAKLSNNEIDGLIQMREEEKLARDVYTKLFEKWDIRSFGNISGSEQTHTSRIKDLLEKYNLPDPVTDDVVGVFQNPKMTELYKNLVEKGNVSLKDALEVGVTIEEMDIKDLKEKIAQTSNQEIIFVYNNLLNGSYNHLQAFQKNLLK